MNKRHLQRHKHIAGLVAEIERLNRLLDDRYVRSHLLDLSHIGSIDSPHAHIFRVTIDFDYGQLHRLPPAYIRDIVERQVRRSAEKVFEAMKKTAEEERNRSHVVHPPPPMVPPPPPCKGTSQNFSNKRQNGSGCATSTAVSSTKDDPIPAIAVGMMIRELL